MCGIVGYTGEKNAVPYLVSGLKKLEYRGYDSAGIAVNLNGKTETVKCVGKVANLENTLGERNLFSNSGIGHTRWATHGEVNERNAHPHTSYKGRFTVVHNGIIENYSALREKLRDEGYAFLSDTDSEVIAHLLERDYNGDIVSSVVNMSKKLEGSYALAVMCSEMPDCLVVTRKDSPLIVGKGPHGFFASSDINALCGVCQGAVKLNDGEIAVLTKDKATFYLPCGNEVFKKFKAFDFCSQQSEKGDFPHFMLKEIFEQPSALKKTLSSVLSTGNGDTEYLSFLPSLLKDTSRIYIIGCGSAYHVGCAGKYVFEKLTKIPTEAIVASEFRYADVPVNNRSLCIVISQSGETADSLAALRLAKEKGATILSVVNVPSSTIACESHKVIYTKAGPEIAVATTKAYCAQLGVIYTLAVHSGHCLGVINEGDYRYYCNELLCLSQKLDNLLLRTDEEKDFAHLFSEQSSIRFIGRGTDYAAAMEGALKMKEVSYIPCEAYPAGELKHGTISLVEKGSLVIALCCNDRLFKKTASNIEEIRSRGGEIVVITTEKHTEDVTEIDRKIIVPDTDDLFVTLIEAVPLQLLSYYVAKEKGCDIDKPRNLAKSVTVE